MAVKYFRIKRAPLQDDGSRKWPLDCLENLAFNGLIQCGLLERIDHPLDSNYTIGALQCGAEKCDFDFTHPDFEELPEDVGAALFVKAKNPNKIAKEKATLANHEAAQSQLTAEIVMKEMSIDKLTGELAEAEKVLNANPA